MDLEMSRTRRARGLEYASVVLAALEALGALLSGWIAGSVALVAFGADSVIEMLSAMVVLGSLLSLTGTRARRRISDHRAHRILAGLFFTLALYVTVSALGALAAHHHVHENVLGVVVSVASGVAMPLLAMRKRASSRGLAAQGRSSLARLMRADAAETALCAVLAWSTLVGVVLAWIHWWWADPVASLVVVVFALREGREAWACADD
jgi:divalent metal cation (Fe/Co/Zn/Cd) transporter